MHKLDHIRRGEPNLDWFANNSTLFLGSQGDVDYCLSKYIKSNRTHYTQDFFRVDIFDVDNNNSLLSLFDIMGQIANAKLRTGDTLLITGINLHDVSSIDCQMEFDFRWFDINKISNPNWLSELTIMLEGWCWRKGVDLVMQIEKAKFDEYPSPFLMIFDNVFEVKFGKLFKVNRNNIFKK